MRVSDRQDGRRSTPRTTSRSTDSHLREDLERRKLPVLGALVSVMLVDNGDSLKDHPDSGCKL